MSQIFFLFYIYFVSLLNFLSKLNQEHALYFFFFHKYFHLINPVMTFLIFTIRWHFLLTDLGSFYIPTFCAIFVSWPIINICLLTKFPNKVFFVFVNLEFLLLFWPFSLYHPPKVLGFWGKWINWFYWLLNPSRATLCLQVRESHSYLHI